jgi:GMP synthase-like glutamine amidotransferase
MQEKKEKSKKISKKVLIVDYGSKSAENIANMYKEHSQHSGIEYVIEIKTEEDLLKLKGEGNGKALHDYHIIHQSGSRVRNLGEEAAKYLMDNAHKDTYMIGTCHGAQEIAKYHKVESKKLKKHQKGKQEIKYGNQTRHIHKNHSWGIPVDSNSKLETIATSEQEFHKGEKGQIYEVFKVKGKNHYGIQGHGEQGVGKDIMYELLDKLTTQQKTKKHSQEKKYPSTQ